MIDRFRTAFTTELGMIFALLLLLLAGLGAAYGFLLLLQRKRDRLKYLYRAYYEAAEKKLEGITFSKKPIADFFGRESVVTYPSGEKFYCLIPPPYKYSQKAREKFEHYIRSIAAIKLDNLSSYLFTSTDECWITVQEGLLYSDGRKLLTLDKWIKDGRLTTAVKEQILVDIARSLAKLHRCHTENGENLYHGFLLPRTLFIESETSGSVKRVVIAHHGFAFAIGAEEMQRHFAKLEAGKMCIDRFACNELLPQLAMLAPEQRDLKGRGSVGPYSDFYSFAALALFLFTGKRCSSKEEPSWRDVPERWSYFLKSSLSKEVDRRPKSFDELEVWLSDPEFFLTLRDENISPLGSSGESSPSHPMECELQLEAFRELTKERGDKGGGAGSSTNCFREGDEAFRRGDWEAAKELLIKASEKEKNNPELLLHLAIAHYELGEFDSAEREVDALKSIDPQLAKEFGKHIAFSKL